MEGKACKRHFWILVTCLFALKVTADDMTSWSVTVTPTRQKVAEGSMAIFTCKSSLPARVRFQWTKGVKPIKNRDSIEIVQIDYNRSVLKIEVVHLKKHRRSFRCTAYYEDPLSKSVLNKSANAVLKIVAKSKLPPKFPRVSSKIRKQLAESRPGMIPLFCEIEQPWSKQTPTFTWIKDSVIDLRLEKDHWESNGRMQILYVKPSQAIREYQCAVFYKRGGVAAYSNKTVADHVIAGDTKLTADNMTSWSVTVTPTRQKVAEGSMAIFTCKSSLPARVRFQWTKGVKPIKNRDSIEIVQIDYNRSVLKIDVVHLKKHRRSFRCTAYYEDPLSKSVLDKSANAVLKIVAKSKLPPKFPRVSSKIRKQLAESRPGMVPLFCEIEQPWSKQTPTFTWIKDSVIDLRLEKDHWESNDGMQILYVKPSQAIGEYQCAVFYKRGRVAAYSNKTAADVIAGDTKSCLAYNGTSVATGAWYTPRRDPCFKCRCENGNPETCTFTMCKPEPISCKNPKPDPNVCCKYICEDAQRPKDSRTCLAYNGTRVATGAWYSPKRDPCIKCRCEHGNPGTCLSPLCMPPPISCKNPKFDQNVCCKYTCEEAPRPQSSRTCLAYNGTRVATGAWYSPERDPCFKCRCEHGNPVTCLFSSCVSPPISCKNPKFDQNVCCKYTCEEAPRPQSSRACLAYNGTSVATGAWYTPRRDPCFKCRCENGNPETCTFTMCKPEPISCKNPKPDPNVCCKYICEDAQRPKDSRTCLAYNGTRVATGAWYSPKRDPCIKCRCEHGNPGTCLSPLCMPPPISCKNPKFDQNVCCKYTCEEAPRPQSSRTCLAYNGTRVATGAWYSPEWDPCYKCRCENGNPSTCLFSSCVSPPISCKNPKFDQNVCCKYTCEEAPRPKSSRTCFAYNGTRVATGAWYSPERDPCYKCRCENRNPNTCLFSSCVSPPISCKNPKFDQNVCCKYTCEEAPRPKSSRRLQMG